MHSLVSDEPFFPEGSFAHAVLTVREIVASFSGLSRDWRLWFLVRTLPELRVLPHLQRPIRDEIVELAPDLAPHLDHPLLPFFAARVHPVEIEVRAGNRDRALSIAPATHRRLAGTGILERDHQKLFIAPLDPEVWPASLPMLEAAVRSGSLEMVERIAALLDPSPQVRLQVALARWRCGDRRALDTIQCIKPRSLAKRAFAPVPDRASELEASLLQHYGNEEGPFPFTRKQRLLLRDPEIDLPFLSALQWIAPRRAALPDAVIARVLVHTVRRFDLSSKVDQLQELAPTPACAFARGIAGDRDVASAFPEEVRLWFDRGLALSADPKPVRRVLIDACRASLHRAFTTNADHDRAVCCRLDTLVDLGGEAAARAIAGVLTRTPHSRHALPAFTALAQIDARVAASLLFQRYREVTANGRFAFAMMMSLERHRALENGYARTWSRAVRRIRLGPDETQRWLSAYAAEWWRCSSRPVGIAVIESISWGEIAPTSDPIGQVRGAFADAIALQNEKPMPLVRKLSRRPILLRHLLCFPTHRH